MRAEEEPTPSRYLMQLFVARWQGDHREVVALRSSRLILLEDAAASESADVRLRVA